MNDDRSSLEQDIEAALKCPEAWFFEAVFDAFDFLKVYGYVLSQVSVHHRGHSVSYDAKRRAVPAPDPRRTYRVTLSYDLEWLSVDGDITDLRTLVRGRLAELEDIPWLLRQRAPEVEWLNPIQDADEAQIIAAIRQWATGLRAHAADILEGAPLPVDPRRSLGKAIGTMPGPE